MPVVGAGRYHSDALQREEFGVARELSLRAEPENPHDPNAVAVYDHEGQHHVGYVPREHAKAVREGVKEGVRAFYAWETLEGGQRVGLRMVLANRALSPHIATAMAQVRKVAGS